ncbi:MAG: hypothetical protein EOR67_24105 [Mesorhizobium sp.]|uniref:HEAT repeat domain-containing protein n=1 Tax=Mesorhizobium sp. TaxID=1871066 RepID=UPI000FEA31F0|nr:HEAT repeat domain-containing protein [Mesorhizobium sp.]RWL78812.1 MAG: hypothetical protein EOR69_26185 [Mesorhizobium sp.]RWL84019.1 MAG: hypothetical protein EOR67_24105 [Mesorhizobium sp.]RWL94792.1 MAG: hypothetical protein EOR70_24490 [Mesorhizobium sp.]
MKAQGPRPTRVAAEVIRQHAELAAFLWAQRDSWSAEDPPDAKVIAEIDERLEINLDALRIAGAPAWPFLIAQHEDFPDKGELFAFAWMALELADNKKVAQSVELGRVTSDDARGLVGALAWHKPAVIGPFVREWIGDRDAFLRFLGISACIEHKVDPGTTLARLGKDHDFRVRAAALRLAGQLRRFDLARDVHAALDHEDERVRLWASWALVELGSGDLARRELRKIATAAGPDAMIAMRALAKAGPDKDVRAWMGGLMKSQRTAPLAVRGVGMLGDRSVLAWLIERMREPYLAVAACAAFLELFPEAREETKLFTVDPTDLGPAFAEFFGDEVVGVAVPDRVEFWRAQNRVA